MSDKKDNQTSGKQPSRKRRCVRPNSSKKTVTVSPPQPQDGKLQQVKTVSPRYIYREVTNVDTPADSNVRTYVACKQVGVYMLCNVSDPPPLFASENRNYLFEQLHDDYPLYYRSPHPGRAKRPTVPTTTGRAKRPTAPTTIPAYTLGAK